MTTNSQGTSEARARRVPQIPDEVVRRVEELCVELYSATHSLTFHDWRHIEFVRGKALEFASKNGAVRNVVEVAALVHDLNYLVRRNSNAEDGRVLRRNLLAEAGLAEDAIKEVEETVSRAETRKRERNPSLETQALSDADTLYKILPVTPVLLSPKYMEENGVTVAELARKIVDEQDHILDEGYYFYDGDAARRYGRWAQANLELWRCIADSVDDEDVQSLIRLQGG